MKRDHFLVVTTVLLILLSACAAGQSETPVAGTSPLATPVSEPTNPAKSDSSGAPVDFQSTEQAAGEEAADSQSLDAEQSPAESIVAEPTDELVAVEPVADTASEETMTVDRPAWQHLELTNARTGEVFSLADFEGKTIFVEPFATWCGNCRRQLTNVRDAKLQLSSDDVVFVALSVETNIDNSTLVSYADGQVFDWHFAVATPDLLRHLVDEFGRVITNPPATPHFIIRPDGTTTELVTGIEPAKQIVAQIVAAQG